MTSSGTGWKQARVDIPVDNHGRQIIFEAERGNSASDVAIDDVSLSNKECPPGNFFILFSCNINLIQRYKYLDKTKLIKITYNGLIDIEQM